MKKNVYPLCLIVILLLINTFACIAQDGRYRSQALFILDIASDARSAGMGDVGAATSADAMSQKWNPSKYIFAPSSKGASVSYTPWLNRIEKGMNIGLLSGYVRLENKSAIGFSATYLSIGGMDLRDYAGNYEGTVSTEEYAIDVSYSHRLGDHFSGGITLRYANTFKIESTGGVNGVLRPSPAFAGDVAFFYTKPVEAFNKTTNLAFGTCLSNLGTKVKLSGDEEVFLPMNWRLGVTWDINLDAKNALSTSFDINKSLVPLTYDRNLTVLEAVGKSFGNSRDFVWATGLEYSFMRAAMLRAGYHHSRSSRGYRYFTLGAGLVYKSLKFDTSYLLATSNINTPFSNTFRVSMSYVWN
ncbi:MAG: type IX secretion system outer membrane channel protein PorV [Prevotellaceae bacterium]|nr:type IX secretion system outer membrane channel protein PorV [Prevotellaceae bacterium]